MPTSPMSVKLLVSGSTAMPIPILVPSVRTDSTQPSLASHGRPLKTLQVGIRHLGHGIRGGVHEFREVHGALALILGHMDGLDRGEARVGIPEVLQPQPPLYQAPVRPLHKHLRAAGNGQWARHVRTPAPSLHVPPPRAAEEPTLCFKRTISWERRIRPWSRADCKEETRGPCVRAEPKAWLPG